MLCLDVEIVVCDQRLKAMSLGALADLACEFAAVGPEAHNVEAKLFARDALGRERMGRIAENEDALAG